MKKQLKDILQTAATSINGSIWLESGESRFFGPGPMELLEHIAATGSINQAARKMNMSYKKAWEIVTRLNTVLPVPMVITITGGEKGGGSSISEEAKDVIDYYKQLRDRFRKFLEQECQRLQ